VLFRAVNNCNRFHGAVRATVDKLFLLQSAMVVCFRGSEPERWRVKFLDKLQPLSQLGLRIVLGIIFLAHGYPKLTHTHGNLQGVFRRAWVAGVFCVCFWNP